MSDTQIILGPPGTGKTTTLINLLSDYLSRGVPPNRIGFLSFTKQATEEARGRAMARFGFKEDDLPYFRTLHSLSFRQLGMQPNQVMARANYRELGKALGIEIAGYSNQEEGEAYGLPKGDRLLFICGLSRVRCQTLRETWEEIGEDLDWYEVDQFARALQNYKASHSLMDFTDMLSAFEAKGVCPDLDVLFVDEAQDLSRLQWNIVERLKAHAKETYIAGDDDQAIFRWSGADVETFVSYPGAVTVLDQSYRIPAPVQAIGERILSNIHSRRIKQFRPATHSGSAQFEADPFAVDLGSGDWLILVRNSYQAAAIVDHCRESGFHYSWKGKTGATEAANAARLWERLRANRGEISDDERALLDRYISKKNRSSIDANLPPWFDALDKMHPDDRDYILMASRRGEKLFGAARIRISTIHGAKGGEAQNVMLFTDMSYKTFEGYQKSADDESRVFYVGATRAKENLHVILPQTGRFFEV